MGEAEDEAAGGAGDAVEVGEAEAGAKFEDGLTVAAGLGLALGVRLFGGGTKVPVFALVFEDGDGSVEGDEGSTDVEVDEIPMRGPVEAIEETIGAGGDDEMGVGGIKEGDEDEDEVGVEVEVEAARGGSDGTVNGDAVGDDAAGSAGTFETTGDGMETGGLMHQSVVHLRRARECSRTTRRTTERVVQWA